MCLDPNCLRCNCSTCYQLGFILDDQFNTFECFDCHNQCTCFGREECCFCNGTGKNLYLGPCSQCEGKGYLE